MVSARGSYFRLLHFRYRSDLIQITLEYSSIGNVLARFRELQQNHTRTDDEKSHNNIDNLNGGPVEALEEDCARHNGATGEVDVVCGSYQRGVEDVESFL